MATIITSDPAIRNRSTGSGTFSSPTTQVGARTTPVKLTPTPAIPASTGGAGYGSKTNSSFSAAAPQPVITAPSNNTYSTSGPALPQPHKARFYPPVYPNSPTPDYTPLPYVYSVAVTNFATITNFPAGAVSELQYNAGHTFAADPGLTFDPVLDKLTVIGDVAATGILTDNLRYANGSSWVFASPYGNANVASYLVTYAGMLSGTLTTNAQPNITSIGTLDTLQVHGNIAVGGILTDHLYYANGTIRPTGGSGITGALSISPEIFRGNGVQTVFTLVVDPVDINNTQIYISGVYQQKATYTCVAGVLTFSQPPPAPGGSEPDNIEVLIYSLI